MNEANHDHRSWSRVLSLGKLPLIILITIAGCLVVIFVIVRYGYPAPWTGFDQTPINDPNQFQPRKLLWDWLELLIIPIFLLIAGSIYSEWQKRTEYRLAKDKENSAALQAYFDSMKDLIIDGRLTETVDDPDHPVRALAISKTITTMQIVDDERRKAVLNFLSHAGLIVFNQPLILLDGLELNDVILPNIKLTFVDLGSVALKFADISGATLSRCNLALADLRYARARQSVFTDTALDDAVLDGADFQQSTMKGSRFVGSHLAKTKFNKSQLSSMLFQGADLRETDFSEARLSDCDFSNIDDTEVGKTIIKNTRFIKANLQRACFHGVDFSQGVDFRQAVLDGSDFRGSNITEEQLKVAKSTKDVTLPDGWRL